jgi:hypothetical protein
MVIRSPVMAHLIPEPNWLFVRYSFASRYVSHTVTFVLCAETPLDGAQLLGYLHPNQLCTATSTFNTVCSLFI